MLTMSKAMSADDAAAYYDKNGKEEYYLAEKGTFGGKAAEALGIAGKDVDRATFCRILDGEDPKTGDQLVKESNSNGERRAGWDVTMSAPKSVSVLAVSDDRLFDAHRSAVAAVMSRIEERFAITRVPDGAGGQKHVTAGNLVYASFAHHTSRELDPQLHTHTFIANLLRGPDGQWRSLDPREMYKAQKELGMEYRAELARNVRELGYRIEVTDRRSGFFELAGMPQALIREFSQRAEQVVTRETELRADPAKRGKTDAEIHEMAVLSTRRGKEEANPAEVKAEWEQRAAEAAGKGLKEVQRDALLVGLQTERQAPSSAAIDGLVRSAADSLAEHESVISSDKVAAAALKLGLGSGMVRSDVDAALARLEAGGEVVLLAQNELHGGLLVSTREVFRAEHSFLDRLHAAVGGWEGQAVAKYVVDKHLAGSPLRLTDGQEAAVRSILSNSDRVALVQGDAGVGKTTAMQVVKGIADAEGIAVRGLAPTGKAAQELTSAGIPAQTIDSFLSSPPSKSDRDGKPEIWVVDEAGMVGSINALAVQRIADAQGAKVVWMGDTKQFASISAGRAFGDAQELGGIAVTRMDQATRPKTDLMREVFTHAAAGRSDAVLDALAGAGKVKEIEDRGARLDAVKAAYLEAAGRRHEDGKEWSALALTARNADRVELNAAIRGELVNRGQVQVGGEFAVLVAKNISGPAAKMADSYQPGDVVKTYAKAGKLPAGAEAKVVARDLNANTITVRGAGRDGKPVEVSVEVGQHGDKLSVYEEQARRFGAGDRVVALQNDRDLGLQNGGMGTIERVTDGVAHVRFDSDAAVLKAVSLHNYRHIDHGYAVTDYKSQGATVDSVIVHAPAADGHTSNSHYVGITRGRHEAQVITDDVAAYREQVREETLKSSTLDFRQSPSPVDPVEVGQGEVKEPAKPAPAVPSPAIVDTPQKGQEIAVSGHEPDPPQPTAMQFSTAGERGRFAHGETFFGVGGTGLAVANDFGGMAFQRGGTWTWAGERHTKTTRYILTGEHKGTTVTRSERKDAMGTVHAKETITRSDGTKIEAEESKHTADFGLWQTTVTYRTERLPDGSRKESVVKSSTDGGISGKTTVYRPDGTVSETKWKGVRSLLTGKIKILQSETKTWGEKAPDMRPLSDRAVRAIGIAIMRVAAVAKGDRKALDDLSKIAAAERVRDRAQGLMTVRDNITGRYTKTGSVVRKDGAVVEVREQGIQAGSKSEKFREEVATKDGVRTRRTQEVRRDGNRIEGTVRQYDNKGNGRETKWSGKLDRDGKIVVDREATKSRQLGAKEAAQDRQSRVPKEGIANASPARDRSREMERER